MWAAHPYSGTWIWAVIGAFPSSLLVVLTPLSRLFSELGAPTGEILLFGAAGALQWGAVGWLIGLWMRGDGYLGIEQ
jgi:hypothetical protein